MPETAECPECGRDIFADPAGNTPCPCGYNESVTFDFHGDPFTLKRLADYCEEIRKAATAVRVDQGMRDALVRVAFASGVSQAVIGKVTGLTRQRIQQICGKDEGR